MYNFCEAHTIFFKHTHKLYQRLPSIVAKNHRGLPFWWRQNCDNRFCSTTVFNCFNRRSLKILLHWFHVLSMNTARLIGKLSCVNAAEWLRFSADRFWSLWAITSLRRYFSNVLRFTPFGSRKSSTFSNRTCSSKIPSTWIELCVGNIKTCKTNETNRFDCNCQLRSLQFFTYRFCVIGRIVIGYIRICVNANIGRC